MWPPLDEDFEDVADDQREAAPRADIDEPWNDPRLQDPLHGIPAAVGDSIPITTRDEYLAQPRPDTAAYMEAKRQSYSIVHTLPAEPPPIVFDALQEKAITDCSVHLFTNISGTAGVGKTFVAKEIVKRYPGVALLATTGIAAVNLGEGSTINACLHYYNTTQLRFKYMDGSLRRMIDHLRKAGISRLLIDEKSMMAGQQLTDLTRAVRESNEGGVYALEDVGVGEAAERDESRKRPEPPLMGITLVGDFGQLPPVPDEEEYKDGNGNRQWRKLPVKFCFDSPEWSLYAANTTRLETIYRQEAKDFIAALHAIRAGRVMDALRFFTPERFTDVQDDNFDGTTIFAKNEQVDRYNQIRLDALTTPKMIARSIRQGEQRPDWKLIPDTLVLKEGALVMLLANRRVYDSPTDDRGRLIYANGDLAHLLGKDEQGAWVAKLIRNNKRVIVYPVIRENTIPLQPGRRKAIKQAIKAEMAQAGYIYAAEQDESDEDTSYLNVAPSAVDDPIWSIRDPVEREQVAAAREIRLAKQREKDEFQSRLAMQITDKGKGKFEIIGTITYMPLRAAYGCTVHKTQGLTLDRVQVNISDWFFKQPGMMFVALSRARTAEGLRIVGNQELFVQRCRVEPRVQPWL